MKKFFSGLALLAAVILLASCQDDLFDWGHKLKLSENEIAFRVGNDVTATRAEVQRTVVAPNNVYDLPVTDDGQKFCLVETVTSLSDEVFNTFDGAVTRGTPVYTENFGTIYGGFAGTAYGDFTPATSAADKVELTSAELWGGQNYYRAAFTPVQNEPGYYSHNYDGPDFNLGWPSNNKLLFFLEAPTPAANGNNEGVSNVKYYSDGSIEFDYQSPLDEEGNPKGPKFQKDLLFTSKWMNKDTKDTDNGILFYHALCGVKFKVGKPSTHNIHININKVTLVQHQSAGHCIITPNYTTQANTSVGGHPSNIDGAANTKSAVCVDWDEVTNAKDFVLDIDDFIEYEENDNGVETTQILMNGTSKYTDYSYFPKSFFANGKSGGSYANESTADKNFNNDTYEYTFMMVPQKLGQAGVTMEIEYTYYYGSDHYRPAEAHKNTAHVVITDPNAAWNAGELHTYYLTSEGVYISVEDEIVDNLKSSLKVVNTGTFAQYQRCLMYANWVYTDEKEPDDEGVGGYEHHLVVASAELPTTSTDADDYKGKFTGFLGKNWALGSDGFYYYRYPIDVGNKPNYPLFDTYEGPTKTPFNGTHLEYDISAQAVRYSYRSYDDNGQPIQNDNTYVEDYNRQFVINSWNLNNVTVVRYMDASGTLQTPSGLTVAAWMGLSGSGQDPQPEVFDKTLPGNNQ